MCRAVRAHINQEHRFAHSIRVARFAQSLASVHGENTSRARIAGMLHDLARLYPTDQLVQECENRGLAIDDFERGSPVVLHARLGAELARERFGIVDEAILSAIRKHTLAAAKMSVLDCIVYLADTLEPGRAYADRAALAELSRRDLRAAMRATIASSIRYLAAKQLPAAPQTLEAARAFGLSMKNQEVLTAGTT